MNRGSRESWTAKDVRELTEALRVLAVVEAEFQKRKVEVVSQALRTPVGSCNVCHRPLITRRLWDMLPPEVRGNGGIARRHDAQTCFSHYMRRYRVGSRKRLEADRLARLRVLVGYDPAKNYDVLEAAHDEMEESA